MHLNVNLLKPKMVGFFYSQLIHPKQPPNHQTTIGIAFSKDLLKHKTKLVQRPMPVINKCSTKTKVKTKNGLRPKQDHAKTKTRLSQKPISGQYKDHYKAMTKTSPWRHDKHKINHRSKTRTTGRRPQHCTWGQVCRSSAPTQTKIVLAEGQHQSSYLYLYLKLSQ